MSRRNLTVLLSTLLLSIVCYARNTPDPHARYLTEAYEEIDRTALFDPGDDALVAGAMRGMVDVLRRRGDEHSGYSDPTASEQFWADIRQEFGGVGVRIRLMGEPPRLVIVGPPEPGSPASRAELRPDDVIDAIDGVPVSEIVAQAVEQQEAPMKGVLERMRGPIGETVTLTVTRGEGEEATTTATPLVRDQIEVASVLGDRRKANGEWVFRLEDHPEIALLRITSFGNKTLLEVKERLPELIAAGVRAFILDLRNNPGGALDVAIDTCDLFLTKGSPIVETRGRNEERIIGFKAKGGPYPSVPLAVLIDRDSASAAEIMAACLQDNGRAVVVGERSFGKGTVQRILYMESGRTLLKLTTASYWRPSGVNIHRMPGDAPTADWGVQPDDGYEVSLTAQELLQWRVARDERDLSVISDDPKEEDEAGDSWSDPVLELALTHLGSELGGGRDSAAAGN